MEVGDTTVAVKNSRIKNVENRLFQSQARTELIYR
jgi:hypothetical protein